MNPKDEKQQNTISNNASNHQNKKMNSNHSPFDPYYHHSKHQDFLVYEKKTAQVKIKQIELFHQPFIKFIG